MAGQGMFCTNQDYSYFEVTHCANGLIPFDSWGGLLTRDTNFVNPLRFTRNRVAPNYCVKPCEQGKNFTTLANGPLPGAESPGKPLCF